MSDLQIISEQRRQAKELRRQQAKPLGPTLGEFYSQFLGLPGLRGLWYPGAVNSAGGVPDRSGNGLTLSYNGNPTMALASVADYVPHFIYDGTGDFHNRTDEANFEISGTEGYIGSGYKGLTAGGWFWIDSFGAGDRGLLSKYNATGNQRAYLLYTNNAAPDARAIVSTDGTATTQVNHGTALAIDTWYFIWMRFRPSTSLSISVNNDTVSNTTSIPASIFATGTANFEIGSFNGGGSLMTGQWGLTFLCAAALPDALMRYQFERSRPLFGV